MNELTPEEFADIMTSLKDNDESTCIEAKLNFWDLTKIWQTISALSNAASYHDTSYAYMIWGIENNTWEMRGTTFDARKEKRWSQDFWLWLQAKLWHRDVIEDFTYQYNWNRFYIMRIKQCGSSPINFDNTPYIKINSHNQLLNRYPDHLKKILTKQEDRTAKICIWATLLDLSPEALLLARKNYTSIKPNLADEIAEWDDETFLIKTKCAIWSQVTNAGMLLLWKPESSHLLSPHIAQISWILKNRDGDKIDYEHFDWPLLLAVDRVFAKIRNLKYRYMTGESMFPEEVDKYDSYVLREALNNCIAHQDYTLCWRINVIEAEDTITFINVWSFLPGSIENVLKQEATHEKYRNPHLASIMVNFKMIDTIWSGIERMFKTQGKRFFPMPDYVIANDKVTVVITGKVLDMNYAKKLLQIPDLSLLDMILLDRVQKKKLLKDDQIKYLKSCGYIEWRKPNLHISLKIAQGTKNVSDYLMLHADIDEQRIKVLEFITLNKNQWVRKKEIYDYLEKKKILEENLDENQKQARLQNILSYLKSEEKIDNRGWWSSRLRFPKLEEN